MSFRILSLSTYNHLFVLPINKRVCFMARVKDHAACIQKLFFVWILHWSIHKAQIVSSSHDDDGDDDGGDQGLRHRRRKRE